MYIIYCPSPRIIFLHIKKNRINYKAKIKFNYAPLKNDLSYFQNVRNLIYTYFYIPGAKQNPSPTMYKYIYTDGSAIEAGKTLEDFAI